MIVKTNTLLGENKLEVIYSTNHLAEIVTPNQPYE
jgi:hypothetical protein